MVRGGVSLVEMEPRLVRTLRHGLYGAIRSRPIAVRIAVLALAVRVVTAPLAFVSNVVYPYEEPSFTVTGTPHLFWDSFARFDSGWYFNVASEGYRYQPDQISNLAFFPLYPMAMRAGGTLLGGPSYRMYFAGILISWVAFVAAMVMLYRLARLDLDERAAERAVVYTAIFPFAFFFGMVYTESVFLLLTVSAFYAFRTQRWGLGALAGALSSATRVNGLFTAVPLAYIGLRDAHPDWRQQVRAAAAAGAVGLGIAAYSAYVYAVSGSPLEWMYSIRRWDYDVGAAPWQPLIALLRQLVRRPYDFLTVEPNGPYDTLNGVTAMVFVAAIPFVWRRLGAAYGSFMLMNLWMPLSSGAFVGLGRYCSVLFPFFIWLAMFRSPVVHQVVVIGFAMFYALCLALFVNLQPIF